MALRPVEAAPVSGVGQSVRGAQDKLAALIRAAPFGDPSTPVLEGLAGTLAAFHEMTSEIGRQIEAAAVPVRDDDLRRAVAQGIGAHAGHLVGTLNFRNVLIVAGMLFVTLLVGAGGGYLYAVTSQSVPVGITCAPHPAGQPFNCTMQMRGD
jgi:hypothetical protein